MMKAQVSNYCSMVAAGLVIALLSGCGEKSEPAQAVPAPAGFTRMEDAGASLAAGTKLYKQDGTEVGTVLAYDPAYTFPSGEKTAGVQVQRIEGGPPAWTPLEVVSNGVYIKK